MTLCPASKSTNAAHQFQRGSYTHGGKVFGVLRCVGCGFIANEYELPSTPMTEAKRMSAETAIKNMAEACLCGYGHNPPCVPCRTAAVIRALSADLEAARATALEEAARACELIDRDDAGNVPSGDGWVWYGKSRDHCAKNIRALKEQP